MRSIWFWSQISINATKNEKNGIFSHILLFITFRLPEVIETRTKPQFQPSSMPWKNVWVNILSGAAVIERPDFDQWKKNSSLYLPSNIFSHSYKSNANDRRGLFIETSIFLIFLFFVLLFIFFRI